MRHAIRVIQALIVLTCIIPTVPGASDLGWPRQYSDGNAKITLYQPQVDSWVDFKKLDAVSPRRSPFQNMRNPSGVSSPSTLRQR